MTIWETGSLGWYVGSSGILFPVGIKVRAKTQPNSWLNTLTLTLTPNRSQNGPKLAVNAAAPRLHGTINFLNCGRRFRSADLSTQFPSKKRPWRPFLSDCETCSFHRSLQFYSLFSRMFPPRREFSCDTTAGVSRIFAVYN